jgi:hypothetical protein
MVARKTKTKKIKKPKTAWIFFSSEKRIELLKSDPTLKFADISRLLSPEWKGIKDKSKYVEMWVRDKQRYQDEIDSLPEQEKIEYLKLNGRKYLRKLNNTPKQPMGSYMFFVQQKHKITRNNFPDENFKQIGSRLGEMWRNMNAEQKLVFQNMAKLDQKRYREEIEAKLLSKTSDSTKDTTTDCLVPPSCPNNQQTQATGLKVDVSS